MESKTYNSDVIVSAYLLTYNHEKYIREALDSMVSQKTNFRYEILIGDDCSTDGTPEILKEYKMKYPDKIKLCLRSENLGGALNFYYLCKEAQGKYLAPLEGDDFWLGENRLQSLVDFLEGNTGYFGVGHRRRRVDIDGNVLGYDPEDELLNSVFDIDQFIKGKRFSIAGSIHKNFFLDSGDKFKDVFSVSRNVGDFQMTTIMLDRGPFYILDDIYGVYRVRNKSGESNYNSSVSRIDRHLDHVNIIRFMTDYFDGKYNFSSDIALRNIGTFGYLIKKMDIRSIISLITKLTISEIINMGMYFPQKVTNKIKRDYK